MDLDGDGVPEVVLVGHRIPYGNGDGAYHVRGIAPAPGAALLMAQHGEGIWTPATSPHRAACVREQGQEGLANGILRWTEEDGTDMVLGVLSTMPMLPAVRWPGTTQKVSCRSPSCPLHHLWQTHGAAFRVVGILPGGELYLELLTFAEGR